jgi:hypothetical protein
MRPGAPSAEMPLKSEKGKAPREKAVEPSRERKEYRVPAERKIERPEKQKAPVERKREYPEQKDIKGIPPEKKVPAKQEGSKFPAERKMERTPPKQREYGSPPQKEMKTPPVEQKERGGSPKKESGKPQQRSRVRDTEKVKFQLSGKLRTTLKRRVWSSIEGIEASKTDVPEQKEKVSPEQKKREQKEIEEPGTQGDPVDKRGEAPIERGR